jgi:hypothetical protein
VHFAQRGSLASRIAEGVHGFPRSLERRGEAAPAFLDDASFIALNFGDYDLRDDELYFAARDQRFQGAGTREIEPASSGWPCVSADDV